MRKTGMLVLVCLAGSFVVGCQKEVRLTVTNITSQGAPVSLAERGIAPMPQGTVPADGGRLPIVLKIPNDFLPVPYTLTAGRCSVDFVITKDSPDELYFHLNDDGIIGPVDKNAKVNYKAKKDTGPVIIQKGEKVE